MQTSLELKVSHLFHDSGLLVVGMHPNEHLLEERVKWPNDKSKQCGWAVWVSRLGQTTRKKHFQREQPRKLGQSTHRGGVC